MDAGQALVRRRQLQDAADSAALAASHIVPPDGCSSGSGAARSPRRHRREAEPQRGSQRDLRLLLRRHLPAGWKDYAVSVSVESPSVFPGIASRGPFMFSAKGSAVNGPVAPIARSVIVLEPSACGALPIAGSGRVRVSGTPYDYGLIE